MSLSKEAKQIVKATVPILEKGGEVLTKHFYKVMLAEYPEVVPYFNKTHQASGDQPRALAHAVLMYAKNIDSLENIGPIASQIINKHVSLNVRADHYPVVGACLLRAMEEVLGKETATPAVIAAWGSAYQQLADILIAAEEDVYKKNETAVGGWRGDRTFSLGRKVVESSEISSFYFRPIDNRPVLPYQPGQYIGIHVKVNGQEVRRNYSLSTTSNRTEYRISVKKEGDGVVSTYLHSLKVGDKVDFIPPAGDFVLNTASTKPLVLISAGVGQTAILTMLEAALADSTRPITYIHTAKDEAAHAFKQHVERLAASHPGRVTIHTWYSRAGRGRLTPDLLATYLPANKDFDAYFTGPKDFMHAVKDKLIETGVPPAQVKFEFFGPAQTI